MAHHGTWAFPKLIPMNMLGTVIQKQPVRCQYNKPFDFQFLYQQVTTNFVKDNSSKCLFCL